MDDYLKNRSNDLLKSLYKSVKKVTSKKDVVADVLDSNNIAQIDPDDIATGSSGVLNKKQGVPEGSDPVVHERCVKKVKKKGHDKSSAFAICNEVKAGQETKKSEEILEKLNKNLEIITKVYKKTKK